MESLKTDSAAVSLRHLVIAMAITAVVSSGAGFALSYSLLEGRPGPAGARGPAGPAGPPGDAGDVTDAQAAADDALSAVDDLKTDLDSLRGQTDDLAFACSQLAAAPALSSEIISCP